MKESTLIETYVEVFNVLGVETAREVVFRGSQSVIGFDGSTITLLYGVAVIVDCPCRPLGMASARNSDEIPV